MTEAPLQPQQPQRAAARQRWAVAFTSPQLLAAYKALLQPLCHAARGYSPL